MPVRSVAVELAEPEDRERWPASVRDRHLNYLNPAGARSQRGPSDYVFVTGRARTDRHLDATAGCDDEEMSDGDPAADDTDSDSGQQVHKTMEPNIYFRPGMVFHGEQRVCQPGAGSQNVKEEHWDVTVTLQEVNLEKGSCSGTIDAGGQEDKPVKTYWTGEIIDDVNFSFVTCKWGASYAVDMSHWREFVGFHNLQRRVMRQHGRSNRLHEQPYIFMRWKEQCFLGRGDEGRNLTIAGFYYICLKRHDGEISGYYYDPSSMPFQKLHVKPRCKSSYYATYRFL